MERIKLLIDMPGTGVAGDILAVSPDRAARWVGKSWAERADSSPPPAPPPVHHDKPMRGKKKADL